MHNMLICMPYTEDWSDQVWEALSQIMQKDTSRSINVYRVDTTKIDKDRIADQIEAEIEKAHVVVFDLTGVNPNVHIEIGFALALEKPVFFITQDRRWITTHLQGRVIEEYSLEADSLERLSLLLLDRARDKIQVIEERKESRHAVLSAQDTYHVECCRNRASAHLEKYIQKASDRIDILTTNVSFLFERYTSTSTKTYFDELNGALSRKGSVLKVRILTLDPESDFAAKRGKQLGYSPTIFRNALRKALEETRAIASKYPLERFEVRTYDDFPNQITYRIDEWIFHCVVVQPTASRKNLTFRLDRHQAGVESSFISHFQNVWGKRC
ncbi:nucleoside 2-deoxyribosyltransferase [Candidatus Eisenbacteria bacterium]|uniref:Nucleoside 2-deoxyribosyltransferase n=1 Tax=Eiseniibacteriota bacterium TaxID=2212470 RepID=A0ABV6YLX5_UNCEI